MTETKGCGCKRSEGGGCHTSGCNKLNTFDWFASIPEDILGKQSLTQYVEVSFNKGSRKDFFINADNDLCFKIGEYVMVEAIFGHDIGQISTTAEMTLLQMKKKKYPTKEVKKKILRKVTEGDMVKYHQYKSKEKEWLMMARKVAQELHLCMKISEVEIQSDGSKVIFYYSAEDRIDFRELIKRYATLFKMKIEMRHISIRHEAAKIGGIGSCGRTLCCSSWLTDLKSINIDAARYQSLSINKAKLSGQCGRLKCCLNFELDSYMEALSLFPRKASSLETEHGKGKLIKKDIFKHTLTYMFTNTIEIFTIEQVNMILAENAKGLVPPSHLYKKNAIEKNNKSSLDFGNIESMHLKT